jgi:hypothetical protein
MKTRTWIILIIVGAILIIVGLSIAWRVEMVKQKFGVPPYTYEMEVPSTPYFIPGIALTAIGGLLISISILGFIIGYQKEAAKEIISEGIRKWKEPAPPPPPSANVKYCPKCGASMSKEAIYCPKCGQKQSET